VRTTKIFLMIVRNNTVRSQIFPEEQKELTTVSFTILATRNLTPKRRIIE
jgi:hypothetical protein